jgi:D-arabinose 1-dehydrogenase-like Zn-dependent alcohol dehydrogenase
MGKLCVLAPVGNIEINSVDLIMGGCSVHGWPSGHALDPGEAIVFSRTHGVMCMVERLRMEKAPEAIEQMLANKVRFRVVLVMLGKLIYNRLIEAHQQA